MLLTLGILLVIGGIICLISGDGPAARAEKKTLGIESSFGMAMGFGCGVLMLLIVALFLFVFLFGRF